METAAAAVDVINVFTGGIFVCYNHITINIKEGDDMTGKEIVNLIRSLRADGMSDTKILDLIEYIETHDPKEIESNKTNV